MSNVQPVQIYRIWLRNFLIFKRTWPVSAFWIFLEPTFQLAALGFGLGTYVKTIGGIPYVEFLFPGLLCSTSALVAFLEASYGGFIKLQHAKTYSVQLLAPLTIQELALGEAFWAATKGCVSALGVLIVGSFMGLVDNFLPFAALPILFANAWIFACAGLITTTYVRNFDQIIYPTSGLVVPLIFFSGTYFPLAELNWFFRSLIMLSPLKYAVDITRPLVLNSFEFNLLINAVVLLGFALVLGRVTVYRFLKRFQN